MFTLLLSAIVCLGLWSIAPAAHAFENPQLLPDHPTNVIDLANNLTQIQEEKLDKDLGAFEQETGWKLRVLTQFDQTPGRAVKGFWGLDDKTVMLVADGRGGNILNFSVGEQVYPLLSRTFWVELQTRFGNQFFVRDNGEDQAILQTIQTLELCLRQDGCSVVPGLPREQWLLTLVTSIIGGVILGFTAQPRKAGQGFAWQWALIFSPLWGILFISFGIGPVVTRTSEWLPLARNFIGFLGGAIVAFLLPVFGRLNSEDAES
ncbi:TPM domain-containing protein [filamentous cyanobacterium LEGE 11480]|uniref:TPM domain-containing protein n=2 Tax=Romeriopsis TaxID=2992131 RepID=A0A928VTW2_9CYAN|nr:TPM domain-containing protein [Romeriopsis navalis LEGE 11480]